MQIMFEFRMWVEEYGRCAGLKKGCEHTSREVRMTPARSPVLRLLKAPDTAGSMPLCRYHTTQKVCVVLQLSRSLGPIMMSLAS